MKKKILQSLAIAIVGLTIGMFGSGCASVGKGTHRPITINADYARTQVSLNGGTPKPVPATFDIKTSTKGPFVFVALTDDGRCQRMSIDWVNKDGKYWFVGGGVGWGIVTGVGGLVDLGVDYWTKAYRDLPDDSLMFTFAGQPATVSNPIYYDNRAPVVPDSWKQFPTVIPSPTGISSPSCSKDVHAFSAGKANP